MNKILAIFLTSFLFLSTCFSNPGKTKETSGPKIELLSSHENLDYYFFKISGFEPGEKLHIHSKSLHEVIESDVIMSQSEYMPMLLTAAVIGYPEGDVTITISGEKGKKASHTMHWTNPSFTKTD